MTDGIVSRHLNRRLSRPVAGLLAGTGVSPNGATGFTLLFSLGVGALVGPVRRSSISRTTWDTVTS